MAEERKSDEMTREEKQKAIESFCNKHRCFDCPLNTYCDEVDAPFAMLTDLAINKLYEDYILKPQCEINLKKAEEQLGMEIHLDKDQKAKADAGKAPITLVPMEIVWAIAWIRKYGNEKYGDPDNWKTVESERYRDALMRHLLYYISDPKSVDEESGYPHLWHAACNMAFLMHMDYGDRVYSGDTFESLRWKEIGKGLGQGFKEALNVNSPSTEMRNKGDYLADMLRTQIEKEDDSFQKYLESMTGRPLGYYDDLIDYLSQFDESDAVKVDYVRQKIEEALGKEIDWYEKRRRH